MKTAIPSLFAEYGRYIDTLRAIPGYHDFLKPVERRLLYSLYEVARKGFLKAVTVSSRCVGYYHPHGDISVYETLVQLVTIKNFAIGQGNWGQIDTQDLEAAAPRYTEVKANDFITKLAFEFIEFVSKSDPENLGYEQPDYLPSPIPLGLIGDWLTTGIGIHTVKGPQYSFNDLVKRLTYLLMKQAGMETDDADNIIIPQYRWCDVYEAQAGEFENILTTGIGKIVLIPKMNISKRSIEVLGKVPMNTKTLMSTEDKNYSAKDLSDRNQFRVLVEPDNRIVDQNFVNQIFNIVKTNINIICNAVMDDNSVKTVSVDQLLLNSYTNWVNLFEKKLLNDKTSIENRIRLLNAIIAVREIINQHNLNIKLVSDVVALFKNYTKKYPNVTSKDVEEVCSRYSIKQLIEYNANLQSAILSLNQVNSDLNNLSTIAYNKLLNFTK